MGAGAERGAGTLRAFPLPPGSSCGPQAANPATAMTATTAARPNRLALVFLGQRSKFIAASSSRYTNHEHTHTLSSLAPPQYLHCDGSPDDNPARRRNGLVAASALTSQTTLCPQSLWRSEPQSRCAFQSSAFAHWPE